MKLKHTALYAKGWYKKTDLVEDVKKTLHADGYIPDTKADVISILARELSPIIRSRYGCEDILDVVTGLHPNHFAFNEQDKNDYDGRVIKYFLCKLMVMERGDFEFDNWEPDYNVLPKRERRNNAVFKENRTI